MRRLIVLLCKGTGILVSFVYVLVSSHLIWINETMNASKQTPHHSSMLVSRLKQRSNAQAKPLSWQHANNNITETAFQRTADMNPTADIHVPRGTLNDTELLGLFSAQPSPILNNMLVPPKRAIRVRILLFDHKKRSVTFRPGPTAAISDEMLNIVMDGLSQSPYFELLNATIIPDFTVQPDYVLHEDGDDVVWIADMRRTVFGHSYTIPRQLVQLAAGTVQHHPHTKIHVVLADFRDRILSSTLCTKGVRELQTLLGRGRVRSVLQQVVRGRHWSDAVQFPVMGQVWDSRQDIACFGGVPTLHVPYTVRSDYADCISSLYPSFLPNDTLLSNALPVDTVRPVDVAHFWGGRLEGHAKLRNAVTDLLLELEAVHNTTDRPWKVIADFVSTAAKEGRTQVFSGYLEALLTTKIVVVAQRGMFCTLGERLVFYCTCFLTRSTSPASTHFIDDWEDHYRLFEAITGGALVMTDPMWSLPEGLVHGQSIIVYNSLDHLQEQIEYYLEHPDERLAIARSGYKVAMTKHRTVHWMERIFFGETLTVL